MKPLGKIKEIYANVHPDYWKRKLIHLVIVIPVVWLIYTLLLTLLLQDFAYNDGLSTLLSIVLLVVSTGLTIMSAIFYPYSLYWYKGSFIGSLLNSMYHIGSFWAVILRIIGTLIGGVVIAGVLSPIMGYLTWKKVKKKNLIIGEEKDFA